MCPGERELYPSGCQASGSNSCITGPRRAGSAVVGSAAASFSGAGSAAALSSGAGTDGATSTASRLIFSGLLSEVSSSPVVGLLVVTKKGPEFTRAGHRIVQSTLLLSFFAAPKVSAARCVRQK